ncbi:MAG: DUF2130 domain-containing protein, partial [Chitinophagaceae bacterium]|nr:DUF2130 domain-containing protein [Chitinophagaceae bacterium]
MATNIKCPNCNHEFPLEAAVSEEYKKELREQLVTYKKQKEQELARREQEWQQQMLQKDAELNKRLQQEKEQLQVELDQAIRKRISADFENKLQLLEQNNRENEERLKEARRKEAEFLRQQQDLKNKEAELELEVQKQLQLEREKLSEEIRKIEEQKVAVKETELMLRMKELEKQLEDQKRLADEMKRRAEQGSTQLQGEIQELVLEDMLRSTFPFDQITEVGKGVRGADCIQTVRNGQGLECGRIIFESKRTKEFGGDWIEKLKADMRSRGADVAVLVTQVMPRDMDRFGEKNGVWICSFAEVKAVVHMLR